MKVKHILLQGLSGKIGDRVFSQKFGATYVKVRPVFSYNVDPTPAQKVKRDRFTDAIKFARAVIKDPVLKEIYRKKAAGKHSAYSEAISEYMRGENPALF